MQDARSPWPYQPEEQTMPGTQHAVDLIDSEALDHFESDCAATHVDAEGRYADEAPAHFRYTLATASGTRVVDLCIDHASLSMEDALVLSHSTDDLIDQLEWEVSNASWSLQVLAA
jgi:hypothetical protein